MIRCNQTATFVVAANIVVILLGFTPFFFFFFFFLLHSISIHELVMPFLV